ncbi:predicted protein [Naegleria gruberi]|uniref:Predicted protein n=1 Tax=Naegleria gruberi TaxID=5762 RepID=D2VS14_NAEGR|nr:uncharacterized protein NAEGRDRAFT_71776 [Naegleria gruberi]EFC40339.1 predicted protein [Naegleria gruberi]|eukprot:XP_002673083.1 predicted protein [Naegleria gruberi strain NEG-M]
MNRSRDSLSSSEVEEIVVEYFPQEQTPQAHEVFGQEGDQYHHSDNLAMHYPIQTPLQDETNLLMGHIDFFNNSNNTHNVNDGTIINRANPILISTRLNTQPILIKKSSSPHQLVLKSLKPNNRISKPARKLNSSTLNLLKYADPEYRSKSTNIQTDENVKPQLLNN